MYDQPDPTDRSCFKCGYSAATAHSVCPQCNGPLHTATSIRVRGGLLMAIGIILMGFMGYLLIWALAAFGNVNGPGAKFTGTREEKMMIIGLFSTLIIFGLMSLVTGGWQVAFGRRNRLLSWLVLGIGGLLAVGTGAVILLFD